jgi:hypothetical protein
VAYLNAPPHPIGGFEMFDPWNALTSWLDSSQSRYFVGLVYACTENLGSGCYAHPPELLDEMREVLADFNLPDSMANRHRLIAYSRAIAIGRALEARRASCAVA